jgi:acetylornithine deacetylase/succinyl-diaminopimelate desuccinylase-like protein
MSHPLADQVASKARDNFARTVSNLAEYLRIPAISCDVAHHADVSRLAAKIAHDLEVLGFENARVLELPGALPSVAAERLKAGPDKPTVLIYGHLDLQPVKGEPWRTPPHEATQLGDRLYARGAADDMGGWVSHLAAITAWLEVAGELPVNVRLLIEGEEEIGSPNLERYMDAFPEAFAADVMVLTDCENPSTEIPGLTVSLRGLAEFELTCAAIGSDVHSGLWGNVVPDVSTALVKLLARLVDDDGRFAHLRMEVPEAWRKDAWNVPLTPEVIRVGAHLLDGVDPLPARGRPPAEWMWRQPAVTILTTTLPTPDRQKNALRTAASATLSVRLAPGQEHEKIQGLLENLLLADAPGGVHVTLTARKSSSSSWLYTPQGPAFEAADRAYHKAWGRGLLQVGVGGSIPFVALFGRRYSDLPLILNGVMDPETGAHGPNESLHLGVFEKAIVANVHLYAELGALGRTLAR